MPGSNGSKSKTHQSPKLSPTKLRGGKVVASVEKKLPHKTTKSGTSTGTMSVQHSPFGRGRGAPVINPKNGGPNGAPILDLAPRKVTEEERENQTQSSEPDNLGFEDSRGASGGGSPTSKNKPSDDGRKTPENPENSDLVSEIQKMKLVINHLLNQKQHTGAIPKVPAELRMTQSENRQANIESESQESEQEHSSAEIPTLVREFEEFLKLKRRILPPSRSHTSSESEGVSVTANESDHRRNAPQARRSRRAQPRTCNEMDKWGFKFDNLKGGLSVKAFLFRVNTLKNTYEYRSEDVCKYFHVLLRGEPLDWYYQMLSSEPNPSWQTLQAKLLDRFKSNQTDLKIIRQMQNRRQGKESFESFYNDICSLNHSMEYPKSDKEIISILRENMDDLIRQRIFATETTSLTKFLHICNDAYDDVCRFRQTRKDFYNQRSHKVSEIDEISMDDDIEVLEAKLKNAQRKRSQSHVNRSINIDELSLDEIDEIFKQTKAHKTKTNEKLTCYNCEKSGHGFMFCPLDRVGIFCYKCGKKEVKTSNCPKCKLLNSKGSETFDGNSRPQL